jgi:glycosyltransferase involved in cell wall biosynthesis
MNILFVAHGLNLSGASIHNITLGYELIKRGHVVGIVVRDLAKGTSLGCEFFREKGFKVYQADLPESNLNSIFGFAKRKLDFNSIIKKFQPDIIHVQAPTLTPFCVLSNPYKTTPVVSTYNIEAIGRLKALVAKSVNFFLPDLMGDKALSISTEMKRILVEDIGYKSSKVASFPNSVDNNKFYLPSEEQRLEAKSHFQVRPTATIISIAAILHERKGHKYAIEAVRKLIEQGVDIQLICAGDDAGYASFLKGYVAELGLKNDVLFPGKVNACKLFWASDISILPSLKEGFGLVVLEAMLCGAIVARTPTAGCIDQIIEGKTGFIFDVESTASLVVTLQNILSLSSDWDLIRQQAVFHATTNFSVEIMTNRTLEIYAQCLSEKGRVN